MNTVEHLVRSIMCSNNPWKHIFFMYLWLSVRLNQMNVKNGWTYQAQMCAN